MSTATATLSYVYGIVSAGNVPAIAGIDGHPLVPIEHGDLVALTSPVPKAEFEADGLKDHLENLAWLERTARAHHEVIAAAAAQGEVVPFRLCTLFADDGRVAAMLEREHDRLAATLARLTGCEEWGVKVRAEPTTEAAPATPSAPAAPSAPATPAERGDPQTAPAERPGHAFFARRREQADARRKTAESIERALVATDAVLRQHARASVRLRPQQRSLSGHTGEMVFNAAYLIERSRADAFKHAAGERASALAQAGLTLDITGPFAPYNFTTEPDA